MAMYFNQTITFCMLNFYIDHMVPLPCIIKGHSFEWPDLYYLYCECYSNRLFKAFSKSAFVFLKISISLSVNFIPSLILILPGQKVTFFSISFGKKNSISDPSILYLLSTLLFLLILLCHLSKTLQLLQMLLISHKHVFLSLLHYHYMINHILHKLISVVFL